MNDRLGRWRAFSKPRAALVGAVAVALGAAGLVVAQPAQAAISIDTSKYYVLVNVNSGKALDQYGWSTADGAEFRQWTRTDATNQQFQFISSGSGYYRLKNRFSGKVLDIWGWSTADGGEVNQYTDLDGANQQFKLTGSSNDAVRFINKNSGKAVEVYEWSTADGGDIAQWTDYGNPNQQWKLVAVGSGSTTTTTTTSSSSSSSGTSMNAAWPSAASTTKLTKTVEVSGTYDGGMKRYQGWGGSQAEGQDPLFNLAKGAVIKNVIIGDAAGDGIHCSDTCTLINVWWEDVGEDAATLMKSASSSAVMTIDGGGAKSADDKVFQHNGAGTMVIKNFQASGIGKLYRSCGNCSTQYKRNVTVQNVKVTTPAKTVVFINTNYGDIAKISGLVIVNDSSKKVVICRWSKGVTSGEPSEIGSGINSNCQYTASSVTYK